MRWKELVDFDSTTFIWDIFLLAGPGVGGADGSSIDAEDAFGSPDGLWMDPQRRLWIQTDGAQPIECNDQMLAADPISNDIRRFLVGPNECEITGITVTPDQTTMWINVQHPGDHNPEQSTWPFGGYPRAASVIITKDDRGIIGT